MPHEGPRQLLEGPTSDFQLRTSKVGSWKSEVVRSNFQLQTPNFELPKFEVGSLKLEGPTSDFQLLTSKVRSWKSEVQFGAQNRLKIDLGMIKKMIIFCVDFWIDFWSDLVPSGIFMFFWRIFSLQKGSQNRSRKRSKEWSNLASHGSQNRSRKRSTCW